MVDKILHRKLKSEQNSATLVAPIVLLIVKNLVVLHEGGK